MRHVLRQLTILFGVLALLGLGCKKETTAPLPDAAPPLADAAVPDARVPNAPAPDAGLMIPAGWKVYENPAQGVKIAYPETWYIRERTAEETGSVNSLVVDFNDAPSFYTETEPYYLEAMLFVYAGTITDALRIPESVTLVNQAEFEVNGHKHYKQITQDEFGGNPLTSVSYIAEYNGVIYDLSGFTDSPILEQMVLTLIPQGGE